MDYIKGIQGAVTFFIILSLNNFNENGILTMSYNVKRLY